MSVGGLDSRTEEYKNWPVMEIGVGDDILTRIIETETIDEPETSQTRKAIQDKARSLTGENPAVHKPIDARIFMLDPGSGAWGEGEFYGFLTLPRIGEFLELMVDGFKAMVKVVMIAHFPDRSSLVHLYAKVEGELDDCLRRLAETV